MFGFARKTKDSNPRNSRRQRKNFKLDIEILEDRTVPTPTISLLGASDSNALQGVSQGYSTSTCLGVQIAR
jgi:hypothetical protein